MFLDEAVKQDEKKAVEEIEHCSSSFPFVHIAAKGSLKQLDTDGKSMLKLGYEFSPSNLTFTPVHHDL